MVIFSKLTQSLNAFVPIVSIPVIEKLCKIVSPYALIELADQNQELLSSNTPIINVNVP